MRARGAAGVAVACVALPGCSGDGRPASTPPTPTRSAAVQRVVTFGHSFVQGRYPDPQIAPWPDRVAADLGLALSNRGVGATESPAIAVAVDRYAPRGGDAVAVEPALNDLRHRGRRGLRRYRRSLTRILDHLTVTGERPAAIALLIDPPIAAWRRYRPYDHGTRRILRSYGQATRTLAEGYRVRVVDLGRGWDPAADIGADGVHPNEAGTARIAELVARAASDAVRYTN